MGTGPLGQADCQGHTSNPSCRDQVTRAAAAIVREFTAIVCETAVITATVAVKILGVELFLSLLVTLVLMVLTWKGLTLSLLLWPGLVYGTAGVAM